jgi:competence protein ComGC
MLKSQKGFTLIEMMIVLLIISILLIITIPNVTKHNSTINTKGCEAYQKMVQGQVQAYEVEHNKIPTLKELTDSDYLEEGETICPNGKTLSISAEGVVSVITPEKP